MPRKYSLEIWNSANTALLAVARDPGALQRQRVLLGEETLAVGLPFDDPAMAALVDGAILKLIEPGAGTSSPTTASLSLWRVAAPERRQDDNGARAGLITADALWTDLRQGMVLQKLTNGAVFAEFGLVGLTPTEWIDTYILPGFDGSGITFQRGTVEITEPVDLDFNRTSPLEALRLLEEKTGGELQFRLDATGTIYNVDLLARVGNAAGGAELRYRKNIRGMSRVADETQVVTRLYAWGADGLSLGDARWTINSVTAGVGAGLRDVFINNDALHWEDSSYVGLWLYVVGKGAYAITQHDASDQRLRIQLGVLTTPLAGDKAWIAEDATGTRALWIESPSGKAAFGTRVGTLDLPDIPRVENLVSNPMLSAWGGGLPTGWTRIGSTLPTITQDTTPQYAKAGGSAARVQATVAGAGLLSAAFTIPTGDAERPYLGIAAGLTVISGRVRLELRHSNGKTYPLTVQQGSEGLGVYITLAATPVHAQPLPAGTGQLAIIAHGAAAEFYLDTGMATPIVGEAMGEFYPGDGAHALWADAWAELQRAKNAHAEYRVNVLDLNAADPTAFPYDRLDLGDDVSVRHPELGNVNQRIVEITEDLLDATATHVVIATSPRDRIWDAFRPSVQRRNGKAYTPRLEARIPALLQSSERFDEGPGLLYLDELGNEATASIELRTKAAFADPWPGPATQTINDRQGTFAGIAVAENATLLYQITPKDASGAAGVVFERTFRRASNYDAEIADLQAEIDDLDTYIDGAFADGIIEAGEAAAIRANLRELEAERQDIDAAYAVILANPRLVGAAATALTTAYGAYDAAHDSLVSTINSAIADGLASAAEIASVNAAFATYRTELGDLSEALEDAQQAIRDFETEVAAPGAMIYKQLPGSSNYRTNVAIHLSGATEGGSLKIWTNPNDFDSPVPDVDAPDATLVVPAGTAMRTIASSSHAAMQNILGTARLTKHVYVEFITTGGRSSGINGTALRTFTEGLDDEGKLDPDVPLKDLPTITPRIIQQKAESTGANLLSRTAADEVLRNVTTTVAIKEALTLAQLNAKVGDALSVSANARSTTGASSIRVGLRYRDGASAIIRTDWGNYVSTLTYEDVSTLENSAIPASTVTVQVVYGNNNNTELTQAKNFMLNRGPKALPFEQPPFRPMRETADDITGGSTKTLVNPGYVDGTLRPIKMRDGTAGTDYTGEELGESYDRTIAGLDAAGYVKAGIKDSAVIERAGGGSTRRADAVLDDAEKGRQYIAPADPQELIRNGGGQENENGQSPSGWTHSTGNPLYVAVVAGAKYGDRFLVIDNAAAADSYDLQDIAVSAEDLIEISCWAKTPGIAAGAGLGGGVHALHLTGAGSIEVLETINALLQNTAEVAIGLPDDGAARATWQLCRATIRVLQTGTLRIFAQLGISGTVQGSIHLDGISARRLPKQELASYRALQLVDDRTNAELREGVLARDTVGAKMLPKGARRIACKNTEAVVFEEAFQNTPIVKPGPGATMEQRAKWGTLAQADANSGNGSGTGAAPTAALIRQMFTAISGPAGFTAQLRLAAITSITGKSAAFAAPTTASTIGGTTGSATPATGDVPAFDDTYSADVGIAVDNSTYNKAVSGTVTVALEVRIDGVGSWIEIATETVAYSAAAFGSWVGDVSLVGSINGIAGGNDLFRVKLKAATGGAATFASLSVASLFWSAASVSYASATPNGDADAVDFLILAQA